MQEGRGCSGHAPAVAAAATDGVVLGDAGASPAATDGVVLGDAGASPAATDGVVLSDAGASPDGAALDGAGTSPASPGVEAALAELGAPVHRPAPAEWGLTVPCGGWALHVGLRCAGGLLLAQAEVVGPGAVDPGWALHRNRRDLRLVRYAASAAGALWVHGELPEDAATAARVDELLGRLVQAAEAARAVATAPSW